MSINNSQIVRSKYFAGKPAMDESLSDFKESKQSCKGPKTNNTVKPPKTKTRKAKKPIKGQKDIRTALKGKKNELISYSKDFDTVCRKSGLDVDSEQLQLAIALSKSLHTGASDDASTSQSLNTQGRIAKIRTTLQEYGFKVPESKIVVTNKRKRKQKHEYKLLTTTEEEKHQKISSKYSQILFENLNCSILGDNCSKQEFDTPIYNIGTNLEYECMRDNSIFYVNNLVEKSNTSGTLFRDWSKIPGRPESPVLVDTRVMDFSEILCSQDELDVILSGCIKSAKNILAGKEIRNPKSRIDCNPQDESLTQENEQQTEHKKDNIETNLPIVVIENIDNKESDVRILDEEEKAANDDLELLDVKTNSTTSSREQYRSCSPDIFDDECEVSCVMEISKPHVLSQGQKTKMFTEETNYMDLTECANNVISHNIEKNPLILCNVTRRKSDDFMEITECAVSASQGICEDVNVCALLGSREDVKKIDLTLSPDEKSIIIGTKHDSNNKVIVAESPDCSINGEVLIAAHFENEDVQQFDLTQKSNDESTIILEENFQVTCIAPASKHIIEENKEILFIDEIAFKDLHQPPKDDIDLTQSSGTSGDKTSNTEETTNLKDKRSETMDLTQSSKSSVDIDELPEVNVGNTQPIQSNLDNTIILNEEEYKDVNGKVKKTIIFQDDQVYDLTQAENDNVEQPITNEGSSKVCSQSFYEDFEFDHSDNKDNVDDVEMCENASHKTTKESNDIDLTQSSDGSIRISTSPRLVTSSENIPNNSSLGKRDEISIDYDEICEHESDKESNCNITNRDSLNLKYDSSKSTESNNLENLDNNNDLVSNLSQNSEVFDLTDKELDYSLHKSRHDVQIDNYNFDFGGISVMDDVSGVRPFKESLGQRMSTQTLGESFLPEVYVKKTEEKCVKNAEAYTDESDPAKNYINENVVSAITPKNSEYIIKTDNVTPMLDYASMTTPQRNKELDKYGLKPFKRKRAIQILTHIYNQTHPVVEPYTEDQPSPSKKARTDNIPLHISPKKQLISTQESQKNMVSPLKESGKNSRDTEGKNSKLCEKNIAKNKNINSPRKEGNSSKDNIVNDYEVTSEVAVVKGVDCQPEDWVFQKREKAKVHSCRVPLHIAFHNYVSSRRSLREAILKYEPVNIDVIHKDLVSYGHRYDPKDLLRFLDKKCITVKTTDNNARNKR